MTRRACHDGPLGSVAPAFKRLSVGAGAPCAGFCAACWGFALGRLPGEVEDGTSPGDKKACTAGRKGIERNDKGAGPVEDRRTARIAPAVRGGVRFNQSPSKVRRARVVA